MRQIVLDTETTGLEISLGHRIIEIGCVELLHRRHTGRTFHRYLDPGRDIDAGAQAVHGITREKLAGAPKFHDVAGELLEFISGGELIIHNAEFDVAFVDMELALAAETNPERFAGRTVRALCRVLDTLSLARARHPGQRNNLDALCKRYGIDNSHRELHGALLDARILADVYLAMTGGQSMLALDEARERAAAAGSAQTEAATGPCARPAEALRVIEASVEELAAHAELTALLQKASGGKCLWARLSANAEPTGQPIASPG